MQCRWSHLTVTRAGWFYTFLASFSDDENNPIQSCPLKSTLLTNQETMETPLQRVPNRAIESKSTNKFSWWWCQDIWSGYNTGFPLLQLEPRGLLGSWLVSNQVSNPSSGNNFPFTARYHSCRSEQIQLKSRQQQETAASGDGWQEQWTTTCTAQAEWGTAYCLLEEGAGYNQGYIQLLRHHRVTGQDMICFCKDKT